MIQSCHTKPLARTIPVLLMALLSFFTPGFGQVVTNTSDAGAGSLRQAITDANSNADVNVITFQAGVTGTISLASTLPDITNPVTITGPGLNTITIDAGGAFRIINITTASPVTISGLSIINGNSSSTSGGGINLSVTGNLSVSRCMFSGNKAFNAGGAVNSIGILNVTNCSFFNNSASNSSANMNAQPGGGAISSSGNLTLTGSTFSGNSAFNPNLSVFGQGGAVYVIGGSTAISSITNSTFTGNWSSATGGAITCFSTSQMQVSIINCTVSGNFIRPLSPGGGYGGGIAAAGVVCNMKNTIVAGNSIQASLSTTVDIGGQFVSQGNNLIGAKDNSATGFTNAVSGDQVGTIASPINPLLGQLADNGGPTQTMALLSGSPAINAGLNTGAPATDQRGIARPQQGITDIGAFEVQVPAVCESPVAQAYKSNTTVGTQAFKGELGLEFTINNPAGITIKQLGAFDDKGNGITGLQPGGGVRVAIFSKSTHQVIPGLDAVIIGMADAYTGNHRMKTISPVTLPSGDYVLVAKGYGPNELNGNTGNGGGPYPPGDNGNGAISFGATASYGADDANGFFYPTIAGNFGSNHPFLAGSFTFTTSGPCAAFANLSNLTISQGALTPAFAGGTTAYSASVANNVSSVTVTPTVAEPGSTIKVNGVAIASGNAMPITLPEGSTQVNIVVTASDGTTTKTYTLIVLRALSGSCQSEVMQAYTANTSAGKQAYKGELGMEFKVVNPDGIIINQLGAFDDGANGITGLQNGGVRVAVFNRATHQMVPGLNIVISGSGDPLSGNHRMRNITPVSLPVGDYFIVAKGYGPTELNGNIMSGGGPFPAGNDGGGAIVFADYSSYGSDDPAGFSYPGTEGYFGSNHVFLAGSFRFTKPIPCNGGGLCESATALAYTSNTGTGTQAYRGELGMEFIVNNPGGISIKQLGAFDHGGNGITGTQPGGAVRVAIFNRGTHQIVPGLDVSITGMADTYNGNHRMKYISPVTLLPGDYTIVAKGYGPNEMNGNVFNGGAAFPDGDNSNGAIGFGKQSSYGPDDPSGFSYPAIEGDFGTSHVFLAGTFNFTTNTSCAPASRMAAVIDSVQQIKTAGQDAQIQVVKIYPNPGNGRFDLQLRNVKTPKLNIQVMDAKGQLVEQKTIVVLSNTALLTVAFNLVNQPSGIYLLKVQSADGVKTAKLVIQR